MIEMIENQKCQPPESCTKIAKSTKRNYSEVAPLSDNDIIVPNKCNRITDSFEGEFDANVDKMAKPVKSEVCVPLQSPQWPRRKITRAEFMQISNMGFCRSGLSVTFKCFSQWCNFKASSREQFYYHFMAHHQHDPAVGPFNICKLCQTPTTAKSLEEEFHHMIYSHVNKSRYNESTKDSESESQNTDESASERSSYVNTIAGASVNHSEGKGVTDIDGVEKNMEAIFESDDGNKCSIEIKKEPESAPEQISTKSKLEIASCVSLHVPKSNVKKSTKDEREKYKISTKKCDGKKVAAEKRSYKNSKTDKQTSPMRDESKSSLLSPKNTDTPPKKFKRSMSLKRQIEVSRQDAVPLIANTAKSSKLQENAKRIEKLISEEKSQVSKFPSVSSPPSPCHTAHITIVKQIPPTEAASDPLKQLKTVRGAELMEWLPKTTRRNWKYEVAFMSMKKKNSLIALFKCMGSKCSYTTNAVMQMLSHLTFHENERKGTERKLREEYEDKRSTFQYIKSQMEVLKQEFNDAMAKVENFHLLCSYCTFRGRDPKALLHHVQDVHRKDIFQCGHCFYRSCSQQTCFEHKVEFHPRETCTIFECPERSAFEAAMKQSHERALKKRQKFVTVLQCKCCESAFYPLRQFIEHIETEHSSSEQQSKVSAQMANLEMIFASGSYGMYQCLYCLFGAENEQKMSRHMIEHPSEFSFTCKREPPSTDRDDKPPDFFSTLESTILVNLEKNVKVLPFTDDGVELNDENVAKIVNEVVEKFFLQTQKKSRVSSDDEEGDD